MARITKTIGSRRSSESRRSTGGLRLPKSKTRNAKRALLGRRKSRWQPDPSKPAHELPAEILRMIAEFLPTLRDLKMFAQSYHAFNNVAKDLLWRSVKLGVETWKLNNHTCQRHPDCRRVTLPADIPQPATHWIRRLKLWNTYYSHRPVAWDIGQVLQACPKLEYLDLDASLYGMELGSQTQLPAIKTLNLVFKKGDEAKEITPFATIQTLLEMPSLKTLVVEVTKGYAFSEYFDTMPRANRNFTFEDLRIVVSETFDIEMAMWALIRGCKKLKMFHLQTWGAWKPEDVLNMAELESALMVHRDALGSLAILNCDDFVQYWPQGLERQPRDKPVDLAKFPVLKHLSVSLSLFLGPKSGLLMRRLERVVSPALETIMIQNNVLQEKVYQERVRAQLRDTLKTLMKPQATRPVKVVWWTPPTENTYFVTGPDQTDVSPVADIELEQEEEVFLLDVKESLGTDLDFTTDPSQLFEETTLGYETPELGWRDQGVCGIAPNEHHQRKSERIKALKAKQRKFSAEG